MNREEILNILNKYSFPKDEFIILSGAALTLVGIKDKARDIDISVTKELYSYLLEKYTCTFEKINSYGNTVYFLDSIINFGIDYIDMDYQYIDGYRVQTPGSVKELKLTLNREKDKYDIERIEMWEKRRG